MEFIARPTNLLAPGRSNSIARRELSSMKAGGKQSPFDEVMVELGPPSPRPAEGIWASNPPPDANADAGCLTVGERSTLHWRRGTSL